ncbi:juvenile hormone acid O-methyltransferase [Epargyreus clarus]|uniref:juvenile hormone acid O-methyltransferase n=1 Tax=Epargyreus clarus TaxID=520877 RepID=UPI003C2EF267
MNDAELYQSSNALQKRDACQCLEEFAATIKWKNSGDRIIDIGCGDGSVTTNILKKYLPHNYKEIVGCDISEEMVRFANEKHSNFDTKFIVLDIEGKLPEALRRSFDHAVSFYTLHWIKHQESAFSNIYDLLSEGGDCLLMFIGHMPVYDVYRLLARTKRWRYWLKDVDRYVSPYHDSQEPEKEIKRMMEKIGFTNVDVKSKHSSYVYDSIEAVKKAVKAVNPFKIPKEMYHIFMEDYVNILRDMRFIEPVNNNTDGSVHVRFSYSLLVVSAKK